MPEWIRACAKTDIEREDLIRFDHAGSTYAIYHAPYGVDLHAKLTRDLHRELTHQRVMFRRSGCGQGMSDLLLFPGCCG